MTRSARVVRHRRRHHGHQPPLPPRQGGLDGRRSPGEGRADLRLHLARGGAGHPRPRALGPGPDERLRGAALPRARSRDGAVGELARLRLPARGLLRRRGRFPPVHPLRRTRPGRADGANLAGGGRQAPSLLQLRGGQGRPAYAGGRPRGPGGGGLRAGQGRPRHGRGNPPLHPLHRGRAPPRRRVEGQDRTGRRHLRARRQRRRRLRPAGRGLVRLRAADGQHHPPLLRHRARWRNSRRSTRSCPSSATT